MYLFILFNDIQITIPHITLALLNDLWRYRVNDSTWTWISGSGIVNQLGVYGEKGNASTTNIPGGRSDAVGWYDESTQELWLFGGAGYSSNGSNGMLFHKIKSLYYTHPKFTTRFVE